jgi:protein subunit release factor A
METIIIEIRDSEGGTDSKLLVKDMKDIYLKTIKLQGYKLNSMDEREGLVNLCL